MLKTFLNKKNTKLKKLLIKKKCINKKNKNNKFK